MKKIKHLTLGWMLCVGMVMGLGPVTRPALAAANQNLPDSTVISVVRHKLSQDGLLKGNTISVQISNQTITLAGTVSTLDQKIQAGKDANEAEKSYQVVNHLQITSTNMSDSEIKTQIQNRIERYVFYSVYDWVTVAVDNGTVTLDGWVYQPWDRLQFVKQIRKVPGVTAIRDSIQNEFGSQALRQRIASLIYNDPMLEQYAFQRVPAIHIIVHNGVVTLEGYVRNGQEKYRAESLILNYTDAISVQNNLHIGRGPYAANQ